MTADARRRTPLLIRARERELELWVIQNERAKLAASVAARAQDADGDSIHQECIIMREADVNAFADWNCRGWIGRAILPAVERTPGSRKGERQEAILQLIASHSVG